MNPLTLQCTECPGDQLMCEVQNESEIAITLFARSPGYTDEVCVYLNRAGAEQVHSWLGEWLGR